MSWVAKHNNHVCFLAHSLVVDYRLIKYTKHLCIPVYSLAISIFLKHTLSVCTGIQWLAYKIQITCVIYAVRVSTNLADSQNLCYFVP